MNSGNQDAKGGVSGQSAAGSPKLSGPKTKRHFRNYLLQPLVQVKLGLYCIVLAVFFAVALGGILYVNFAGLINSIVLMTDAEDEVREIFLSYWSGTQIWIYLAFFVYLVATIGLSIFYTHRLVGPTIAFRRHIRSLADGRYNARTYLRRGDAFLEVADELNHLSEILERRSSKS